MRRFLFSIFITATILGCASSSDTRLDNAEDINVTNTEDADLFEGLEDDGLSEDELFAEDKEDNESDLAKDSNEDVTENVDSPENIVEAEMGDSDYYYEAVGGESVARLAYALYGTSKAKAKIRKQNPWIQNVAKVKAGDQIKFNVEEISPRSEYLTKDMLNRYKFELKKRIMEKREQVAENQTMKQTTIRRGETLQIVSQRLYGTTRLWTELFVINHENIPDYDNLKVDTPIAYYEKVDFYGLKAVMASSSDTSAEDAELDSALEFVAGSDKTETAVQEKVEAEVKEAVKTEVKAAAKSVVVNKARSIAGSAPVKAAQKAQPNNVPKATTPIKNNNNKLRTRSPATTSPVKPEGAKLEKQKEQKNQTLVTGTTSTNNSNNSKNINNTTNKSSASANVVNTAKATAPKSALMLQAKKQLKKHMGSLEPNTKKTQEPATKKHTHAHKKKDEQTNLQNHQKQDSLNLMKEPVNGAIGGVGLASSIVAEISREALKRKQVNKNVEINRDRKPEKPKVQKEAKKEQIKKPVKTAKKKKKLAKSVIVAGSTKKVTKKNLLDSLRHRKEMAAKKSKSGFWAENYRRIVAIFLIAFSLVGIFILTRQRRVQVQTAKTFNFLKKQSKVISENTRDQLEKAKAQNSPLPVTGALSDKE